MANKSPDSLFSPSISESQTLESIDHSPGSKQRSFLQMIYNRVTKKKFLEKQKLKFMKSRGRTKHPSDYEEYELNTQRIDNLEEILRNIREKSVHKIHIKNIKESFQSDPEIMAYADKLKEYQTKFLSHLLKKRKTQESELVDINNSLLKRIMNTKLEKNKSLFCKREDYYRMKLSKSSGFHALLSVQDPKCQITTMDRLNPTSMVGDLLREDSDPQSLHLIFHWETGTE
eukprot:CAMPEP_0197014848 /NCGR_PEP_ID=MMETSP1380-20130617/71933_1 /TAXON_ID=5936 /ORGANISM="Euplotes crassus, Strain CT5" /LENGTH=229 /DNA_ID=CAMNT_0042440293 /DNA_START=58 /DNA_END=748 /DNA_ORIENTATION=+